MDTGQRQNWEEGEEMINDKLTNSRANKAMQAGGYLANCLGNERTQPRLVGTFCLDVIDPNFCSYRSLVS